MHRPNGKTDKLASRPSRFRQRQGVGVLPPSGSSQNKPLHLSQDQNPKPCKTTAGLYGVDGASVRSTNTVNPFVRQERGKRKKVFIFIFRDPIFLENEVSRGAVRIPGSVNLV